MFEIKDMDGLGKLGVLQLGNKKVRTPYLMPVINPNVQNPPLKELVEKFDIPMIITNAYIIYKTPELREVAEREGIHRLLGYDGIVETDSGAFQLMVYGDVDVSNAEIVRFQERIGADIANPLDVPPTPNDSREVVRLKCQETLKRLHEARDNLLNSRLSLPIHGGLYKDIRIWYCEQVKDLAKDAEILAVGGVVPFLETQNYVQPVEALLIVRKVLGFSKPVHAFGVGHPMVFALMVAAGADLFDSAAYAIYARDDRLLLPTGTKRLHELSELPCSCPVCSKYTAEELKEMEKEERTKLLALHNLYVSFAELRRIREAIREGSLHEYLEYRCSSHPLLVDALKKLYEEASWISKFVKIAKRHGFKYLRPESSHRPEVFQYRKYSERVLPEPADVLVVKELPDDLNLVDRIAAEVQARFKDKHVELCFASIYGVVPYYLIDVYPYAQSTFPAVKDQEYKRILKMVVSKFLEKHGNKYKKIIVDIRFD
ncbi:MAG: tRNA guanosine(15) transglycosylase TgtA [bacterium]|nr:tRNA guanosine(15) transglycosylase TgtA [bacterium]